MLSIGTTPLSVQVSACLTVAMATVNCHGTGRPVGSPANVLQCVYEA